MGFKFYPSAKAKTMFDLKKQSYTGENPYRLINRLLGKETYKTYVPPQWVPAFHFDDETYVIMMESGDKIRNARQNHKPVPAPELGVLGYFREVKNRRQPSL